MTEAFTKIVPILLLILIGYLIQYKKLADEHTMHNLKKGVINLALPAVLFIAFKDMDLKKEYILISLVIFMMMIVFNLTGNLLNKLFRFKSPVLPFLTTGFAFGLLGIPLYGGVYGLDNVGMLSIFGIGHEFFAWFIYLTLIKQKLNGEKFSSKTLLNFIKSPIIQAILAGVIINLLGWQQWIDRFFLLKGLELTLTSLATMTTPLILIIIGYGIKLEKAYMRKAVQFLVIRLGIVLGIGYLVKIFIMGPILGDTSKLFDMAYYTFLVLPPPFMLAIFVSEFSTEENAAITNNTIVLSTITCVVLFAIGVVITGI